MHWRVIFDSRIDCIIHILSPQLQALAILSGDQPLSCSTECINEITRHANTCPAFQRDCGPASSKLCWIMCCRNPKQHGCNRLRCRLCSFSHMLRLCLADEVKVHHFIRQCYSSTTCLAACLPKQPFTSFGSSYDVVIALVYVPVRSSAAILKQ